MSTKTLQMSKRTEPECHQMQTMQIICLWQRLDTLILEMEEQRSWTKTTEYVVAHMSWVPESKPIQKIWFYKNQSHFYSDQYTNTMSSINKPICITKSNDKIHSAYTSQNTLLTIHNATTTIITVIIIISSSNRSNSSSKSSSSNKFWNN